MPAWTPDGVEGELVVDPHIDGEVGDAVQDGQGRVAVSGLGGDGAEGDQCCGCAGGEECCALRDSHDCS